ncbi:MAG TPA: glycosyltransferase family 4 protein [Candidatus Cybelea sp.]|nr:glycosyltransferase family 4 protein [Candidatus Cybelea sp.]
MTATSRPRIMVVGPFPPTTGGVTTFMLNLMSSPLANDFDFVRFSISRPPKPDVTDNWGYGAVLRGGVLRVAAGVLVTLGNLARFPFALVSERADMVQIQASDYFAFWEPALYAAMARALRRPVSFRIGGAFDMFFDRSSRLVRRVIRAALNLPDMVIVQSDFSRRAVAEAGRSGRVLILPNWLQAALPAQGASPRNPVPTFLFIAGSEAIRKGVDDVLLAARQLADAGVAVHVHMINAPPTLGVRIGALGLNGHFTVDGPLSHGEVLAAMGRADAFLLPSRGEGFPNSLVEAFAIGLPSIVTAVGAVPEMIASGGALTVPPADPAALAAAMMRLASDAELRARLGAEARRAALERYMPERVLLPLAAAYRQLVAVRS